MSGDEEAAAQATFHTLNTSLRLPPELNLLSGNVSENYKTWKRQIQIYLTASGTSQLTNEVQTATILNCGGYDLLKIYDHFTWEGKDKNNPVHVFEKIEQYCNPRKNEVAETHKFWSVKYFEPFDQFLTELRVKASSCNFKEEERMIRDKIVFSTCGKVQQLLLREDNLDLGKAIKICQSYEQANIQAQEMKESREAVKVNKVKSTQQFSRRTPAPRTKNVNRDNERDCKFCGGTHVWRKKKCPAWGKTCSNCSGKNHFAAKCKKVNAIGAEGGDVSDVSNDSDSDTDEFWLNAVRKPGNKKSVTALLSVNDCEIRFQLDSAADVNTICKRYVKKEQIRKSEATLRMFNHTAMKPLGEADLNVTNPKTGEEHTVTFVVVSNKLQCLLGLETIQQMYFITVNDDKFIAKIQTDVSSATSLGDLGEANLTVDPNIKPKVLPCRKLPIALKDRVKDELDTLVERGVLVPVTKPTPWVSQMAVVHKTNGKLRICIDPQALNSALQREHYKLPTLDDILPKLQKAKVFSKLDVKEAFWHVKLDDKSSELTTMITPFGRFRWARLPFGLKVSSEIFQRKLNEALGDLEGTFTIADDIIIAGCGDDGTEARGDNNKKLERLYQRCAESNIVLNNDKKEVGLTELTFHGHTITDKGIKADSAKVDAIVNMPSPTDVTGVKRFCGMVQYMARFLPGLSPMLEPLRALTRKDVEWNWSPECENAFCDVKTKLVTTPVLAYFDSEKPLVLQVDSSKDGLGAVLIQDGKPVEYASRALTTSERKWAQIEKEALAILFGVVRFDQYTYGRKVTIENDHKPLEAILRKPLSSAPRRLQDIMMKLHRYDIQFRFLKGEKLVIADTLSRAFIDDRPRILNVTEEVSDVHLHTTDISDSRLQSIREATAKDTDLQDLLSLVECGWPEKKSSVPDGCKPYFDFRETLCVYTGIIVKGEAIVIPKSLRQDIKCQLHSAHSGYDAMMRRARGTVYWPNISADVKQMADNCEACQELKPRTSKLLLNQHDDGHTPWNKIGMDLFEIKSRNYLVTIDYFSNYIEIDYLSKTSSAQVISIIKKHSSRFGIPTTIVSDGGPQFTSMEFRKFTEGWGISHITSSPNHQRANGKAESAVKVAKHLMMKCERAGSDQYIALMEQRNTPRQDTGMSPNEMMFGRQTRTLLPQLKRGRRQKIAKRENRKKSVKRYHDKSARDHTRLGVGQNVYFEHKSNERWILGKIVDHLGEFTYLIKSQNGATYRRNRLHIRPTKIEANIRDRSPTRRELLVDHKEKEYVHHNKSTKTEKAPEQPRHENGIGSEPSQEPRKYELSTEPVTQHKEKQTSECEQTGCAKEREMTFDPRTISVHTRPIREKREPTKLKDYIRY